MSPLDKRIRTLSPERLAKIRHGVEKESLRVRSDGRLATTSHPAVLGSALTHPCITTDFSEAQLELVTGAHADVGDCHRELEQIHRFVYPAIGDEMLWVSSMPGALPDDDDIPVGQYGASNVGCAKSVYRVGLGNRYGRRMQTISGIHFNWSMPGVSDEDYFALIRNFRRHSFLLLYLFGASPAVCTSFVAGRQHDLQTLAPTTLHMPHATSLRMGRLGYQSQAQDALTVSYNSLESYGASLQDALTRPYPPYEALGIRDADGRYRQLATSLLQIENEFYGTIRPKRVIQPGERPLHALRERGVEYVEVRCMDLDPFVTVGITTSTMHFLDVFLLHCLLSDSPPDTPQEIAALGRNQERTATRGRQPGLQLQAGEREISLIDWGRHIVEECRTIAAALDDARGVTVHRESVDSALAALDEPGSLPSARVLAEMAEDYDNSFVDFARARSAGTKNALMRAPLDTDAQARLAALAQESLKEQRRIEASDTMPFEIYRQQYLSPDRLQVRRRQHERP